MFPDDVILQSKALLKVLRSRSLRIATAESCTGGLIAGALTEIPGSSDVVDRGFVTYSNEAKAELLGVPIALIARVGAVSRETAEAMATGALQRSHAQVSVAVTGVAGPGGGSAEKPVGLVHISVATIAGVHHRECRFGDIGRSDIRLETVRSAFELIRQAVGRLRP